MAQVRAVRKTQGTHLGNIGTTFTARNRPEGTRMASVRPHPTMPGRWRVQYRVDGKQRVDVFHDPVAAHDHAALVDRLGGDAARRILRARESGHGGALTVSAWLHAYVDGLTDDEAHAGTRRTYRGHIVNHIDPHPIGALPLTALTRDDVRQWLAGLTNARTGEQLRAKSRRNVQGLLSAALERAVQDDVLTKNPARGLPIKETVAGEDMVILTRGELAVLVHAIGPRYGPLVAFLAGTGLRWSEATALLVGDVDLDGPVAVVHVTKAWRRLGSGYAVGPPKTRAGRRTVALSTEAADVVAPLLDRPAGEYLFTTERGDWIRNNTFQATHWQPTIRRLNEAGAMTKQPRIHDLRHLYASTMVATGTPLNIVQGQMGHQSITTTVNRYSHFQPDYLAVAAAGASRVLWQAQPAIED